MVAVAVMLQRSVVRSAVGQPVRFHSRISGNSRSVAQPAGRKLIAIAVSRDGGVADGKGSVGEGQMVHDLLAQDPLKPVPRFGMFRVDLRDVSVSRQYARVGGSIIARSRHSQG